MSPMHSAVKRVADVHQPVSASLPKVREKDLLRDASDKILTFAQRRTGRFGLWFSHLMVL